MKKILSVLLLAAAGIAVWLFMPESVPTGDKRADGLYFGAMKTARLKSAFKAQNYDMADVLENKKPVPRLFVEAVPSDFNRSKYDDERPALFTEMLLPVIMKANADVLTERAGIERLKAKFEAKEAFSPEETALLQTAAEKYDVDFNTEDFSKFFNEMLLAVDAVPPSLLLAMAAEDSGFATSRYAREYNAVFHARDWNGSGVEPDEPRKEGETYLIKTFPTLYDAVADRILYLNTVNRFDSLRAARAEYRRTKNPLYGRRIAQAFRLFPDREFKYPDILKHLINQYGWSPLDLAALSN